MTILLFIMNIKKALFTQSGLLILFIMFAIGIRLLFLGVLPTNLSHDELDMVLSSRAIAHTGKDLSGVSFPAFFFQTGLEAKQTNLIPFLLSPYFKFVSLSLFSARLPFVFINLCLGLALIKLASVFYKYQNQNLIILFLFLISPWNFVFSRVTYAAPTALMFLLWGVYFLFRKNEKIYLAVVFFLLSTFSYIGALVILPPIVLLSLCYKWYEAKRIRKKLFVAGSLFLLILGLYFFVSHKAFQEGTVDKRLSEVTFLNTNEVSVTVDKLRKRSFEFVGKRLLINKYTVLAENMVSGYLNTFNVNYLFVSGDPRINYTFIGHGLLYWLDFIVCPLGLVFLKNKGKKFFPVVLIFFLISPLGPAVSNIYSVIYHAFPLMIAFVLVSSFGILSIKHQGWRAVTICLYFLFFIHFIIFYFTQYPIRLGESFNISERTVASLAVRERSQKTDVSIITETPYHVAKQYLFYTNSERYTLPVSNFYDLDGIVISNDCKQTREITIVDQKLNCDYQGLDFIVIQQQKDANYKYKIYGSSICGGISVDTYRRIHKISDYRIEQLDDRLFCNRWIFDKLPD